MSLISTVKTHYTTISIPSTDGVLEITINPMKGEDLGLKKFVDKSDEKGLYTSLCRILPNRISKMVVKKEDGTEVVDDQKPTEAEFLGMLENDFPTFDYIATQFMTGSQKKVLEEMNKKS
jgi:hypothetical protein